MKYQIGDIVRVKNPTNLWVDEEGKFIVVPEGKILKVNDVVFVDDRYRVSLLCCHNTQREYLTNDQQLPDENYEKLLPKVEYITLPKVKDVVVRDEGMLLHKEVWNV